MTQLTDAFDEAMARALCDYRYRFLDPNTRRKQLDVDWWRIDKQNRGCWMLQAHAARLALAAALAERGLKVVSAEVTREMARAALERPSSDVARTLYEDIWTAMHPAAPDLLTEGGE